MTKTRAGTLKRDDITNRHSLRSLAVASQWQIYSDLMGCRISSVRDRAAENGIRDSDVENLGSSKIAILGCAGDLQGG
jgi:hypothetical protein